MTPDFGYGVAIDAGSSGSRIYLYRWPRGALAGGIASEAFVKVEKEALFHDERAPGINDDNGIGIDLLEELVALAGEALPSGVDPSNVPIYLGATAGMRILDPDAEADIMSRVRMLLHSSEFLFRDEWARTISGEEEGAYDWLVANYLKNDGNFPTPDTVYGALDLGGASTQISFLSTVGDHQFPLRIDDAEYPLYTQSFLYYGVDQARMKYDQRCKKTNPCYPTGYTDETSGVSGSSDWNECLSSVAQLFDQTSNCKGLRCLMGSADRPPIDESHKFVAMSAFVYAWDFLGLKVGAETEDLQALNAKAQRVCAMPHRQQIARYERHMLYKSEKRRAEMPHAQCFNAAFAYTLLHTAYGMPVSRTPIEIYDDIDGTKAQWALGLMLVEANKLEPIFKESEQQLDLYGVAEAYNLVFLLSAAAMIVLTSWAFRYVPCRLKKSPDAE
ncbi:hypothetical protein ACHAXT_011009 [Thalassiosira profunda]